MENEIIVKNTKREIFVAEKYELMQITPPAELERRAMKIDLVSQVCAQLEGEKGVDLIRTMNIVRGRQEILNIIQNTMELKNTILGSADTPSGFLTDKDPTKFNKKLGGYHEPYSEQTILSCAVDALLQGVSLHNNEFNILVGRSYITKNGFRHKLRDLPVVSGLSISITPSAKGTGNIKFHGKATWKKDGVKCSLGVDSIYEICVITRDNDSPDFALGKAERKFFKAIFETITGTNVSDGEVGDVGDGEIRPKQIKNITPSNANADFTAPSTPVLPEEKEDVKKGKGRPKKEVTLMPLPISIPLDKLSVLAIEPGKISHASHELSQSMIAEAKAGNYQAFTARLYDTDMINNCAEGDAEAKILEDLHSKILEILKN